MKEYTKEFDGITYMFTEKDLSAPFSSILSKIKDDISYAERQMGAMYTKNIKEKVQSFLDDYIVSSFQYQIFVKNHINEWSKCITPQNSLHRAFSIGSVAEESRQHCLELQHNLVDRMSEIGVPVCKQII